MIASVEKRIVRLKAKYNEQGSQFRKGDVFCEK
jgi:hypothetical protein